MQGACDKGVGRHNGEKGSGYQFQAGGAGGRGLHRDKEAMSARAAPAPMLQGPEVPLGARGRMPLPTIMVELCARSEYVKILTPST